MGSGIGEVNRLYSGRVFLLAARTFILQGVSTGIESIKYVSTDMGWRSRALYEDTGHHTGL